METPAVRRCGTVAYYSNAPTRLGILLPGRVLFLAGVWVLAHILQP